MKLYEGDQVKHCPHRHTFDHWIVGLPIIHPQLLYTTIVTQTDFLIYEPVMWVYIHLEGSYLHYGIFYVQLSFPAQIPVLVVLMSTDIFSCRLQKFHTGRLTGCLLEGEGINFFFCVRGQGFGEVGVIFW